MSDETRSHPDCTHCGTIERAIILWPAEIHRSCPCVCHQARLAHDNEVIRKRERRRK